MPDRIPGMGSVLSVATDFHRDYLALPAHAPGVCMVFWRT